MTQWQFISMGLLFVASTIGFFLPFSALNLRNNGSKAVALVSNILSVSLRGFAAGIVLCVSLMHLLFDANLTYDSLCVTEPLNAKITMLLEANSTSDDLLTALEPEEHYPGVVDL